MQACMHECVCACVDFQSVPSLLGYAYCFYEDIVCVSRVPCPKYISREIDFYCQIDSFMNQKKKDITMWKHSERMGHAGHRGAAWKKRSLLCCLKGATPPLFGLIKMLKKYSYCAKWQIIFFFPKTVYFSLACYFFKVLFLYTTLKIYVSTSQNEVSETALCSDWPGVCRKSVISFLNCPNRSIWVTNGR